MSFPTWPAASSPTWTRPPVRRRRRPGRAGRRRPITGTNWEVTGVEPHVHAPADKALETALAHLAGS
jgi:hypothetical protein